MRQTGDDNRRNDDGTGSFVRSAEQTVVYEKGHASKTKKNSRKGLLYVHG